MKTARQAIWVFLGVIAIVVGSLMLFIQSKTFASILKTVAQRYTPTDFGVSGSFSELSVKPDSAGRGGRPRTRRSC